MPSRSINTRCGLWTDCCFVCINRGNEISQQRTEAREIDRIRVWPDDPVREYLLSIFGLMVDVVAGVERLTVNQRCLNGWTETVLNLRLSAVGSPRSGHRV